MHSNSNTKFNTNIITEIQIADSDKYKNIHIDIEITGENKRPQKPPVKRVRENRGYWYGNGKYRLAVAHSSFDK